MLKKLLKPLRKELLKVDRIKHAVADSLKRKEWAGALLNGGHVRMPEKSDDVLTVEYEGFVVDYQDGRMVGHRGVVPFVMRPLGLWRWKL